LSEPRVIDAVTLRHFGVVDRMDVLERRLAGYPRPYWTLGVQSELLDAAGLDECANALAAPFLRNPYVVPPEGLTEVFMLRRALTVDEHDRREHLGEAESIWVADHLNGAFVTDDHDAFAHAAKNLGGNRVLDTVTLLREAVAADELSAGEAKQIADAIRNSGRHLRAGHPPTFTEDYFRSWPP
jgi:hypothetical protein